MWSYNREIADRCELITIVSSSFTNELAEFGYRLIVEHVSIIEASMMNVCLC